MIIGLKHKGKRVDVEVKRCNFLETGRGLTFRSRKNARALLFDFGRKDLMGLTALFVFFPFLVLWLDDKNKIVGKRIVKPFEFAIHQKKKFSKIIEIPINDKYKKLVTLLVGG